MNKTLDVTTDTEESFTANLTVDLKSPRRIFERLDTFELDLIKQAAGDPEKIKQANDFVDSMREQVMTALEQNGVDVESIFDDAV